MTSNHTNVNLEITPPPPPKKVNKNNRVKSIHLQIILHYIIPTNYYVVKDTLR